MGGTTDYTDSEISEGRPSSRHLTPWVRRISAPSALTSVSSVKSVVPIAGFSPISAVPLGPSLGIALAPDLMRGSDHLVVGSLQSAAPEPPHEKAREHGARGLSETAGQSVLRTPGARRRRRCWTGSSSGRVRRHNRRRSRCARSRGRPRRLRGAGCPRRSSRPAR